MFHPLCSFPVQKLVLGIPTYGRSWLLGESSPKSGIPPIVAEGPGDKGTITKEEGLLSYAEICPQLVSVIFFYFDYNSS